MQRLSTVVASLVVLLLLLVPAALAADPQQNTDRVLISIQGDVTVPTGEQVDVVVVIGGTATIHGDATSVVAIDGRAVFADGTTQEVVAIGSPVEVGPGAVITGDVNTLEPATVTVAAGATVVGSIRDLAPSLVGIGAVLAPAILLLFIGFVLVTIVAGLALAALGARQVRAAEALISHEPGMVLVAGLVGIVLPIVLVAALVVTVVGAPLGIGILVTVWPLTAYVGYLVAGIWIGDWILGRTSTATVRERPYAAAVIGLVVLQILAIVPPISAIASLFGYGAVLLLAWRVVRDGTPAGTAAIRGARNAPAPG